MIISLTLLTNDHAENLIEVGNGGRQIMKGIGHK